MKKTVGLIIAITLIVTLIGCSSVTKNVSPQPHSSISSATSKEKEYSKVNALAAFKADKDFNNYQITDYVLVDDAKIPMLKGVISFYDKKKKNSCNLAFIFGEVSQEICFAKNEVEGVKTFEIADGSNLSYIGNGTVATSIRKIETNEILDYKITCSSEKSTSTTNFKIDSGKRTNRLL